MNSRTIPLRSAWINRIASSTCVHLRNVRWRNVATICIAIVHISFIVRAFTQSFVSIGAGGAGGAGGGGGGDWTLPGSLLLKSFFVNDLRFINFFVLIVKSVEWPFRMIHPLGSMVAAIQRLSIGASFAILQTNSVKLNWIYSQKMLTTTNISFLRIWLNCLSPIEFFEVKQNM